MTDDDIRDAAFFRLWIRMAAEKPGRMAKALANCIYEDDYRRALTAIAIEERINIPAIINIHGPFSVGDRVSHFSGGNGTVTEIKPDGAVLVSFDKDDGGWKGEYDAFWFRMHPKGLTLIVDKSAA